MDKEKRTPGICQDTAGSRDGRAGKVIYIEPINNFV
jgi:hypothetical protein